MCCMVRIEWSGRKEQRQPKILHYWKPAEGQRKPESLPDNQHSSEGWEMSWITEDMGAEIRKCGVWCAFSQPLITEQKYNMENVPDDSLLFNITARNAPKAT